MERAALQVFNISVMAGWMTFAVIILRPILAKLRVPVATRLVLWGMVAVRLLLPFSIESRYSLIPSAETIAEELIDEHDYNFSVQTGLDMIDDPVNQRLYSYYAENSNGEAWPDYLEERDDRAQAEEALQAGAYQAEGKETLDRQGAQPGVKTSLTGRRIVRVFTYVWVGGVAAMLLYGVFSFLFLRRKVSVRMPYHENGGREEAGDPETGASILRAAKVYITEGTDTPFILGILRPVIYLPVTGKEERSLTHQEYEMILAHERAHIRNLDQFWKPLGFLLLSVYWFQPLLWVVYILFCRDIEFACDERVIRRMDAPQVKAYMETLLKCSSRGRQLAACPLAFGEVGVKQRIKAVWDYKKPTFWIVLVGIIACIAVAVTMLTTPEGQKDQDTPAEFSEQTDDYSWPMIRTVSVDLTGDGAPDELTLRYDYSYETVNSADVSSYEKRIARYGGVMVATLTDGATGHNLFEQTYSAAHVGKGVLAIVQKDGRHYLLTGICDVAYTVQWANYEANVLTWENDEPVVIDRYSGSFPVGREAIAREVLREGTGYTFQNCREVTEGLEKFIDGYEDGAELLFASDIMLTQWKETDSQIKDVYLGEKEGQYKLIDYYQFIDEWFQCEYEVSYPKENLYGRSIFCVKETIRTWETTTYFYDAETGEELASAWGGDNGGSIWFVDLDGDGRNELIADTQAFADGGKDLIIYREMDGKSMSGSGEDLLEDEIAAAYEVPGVGIGIWTVYGEYLPETNQIKVYYWNPEKEKHDSRIYDINLDRITFYEYIPL